MKKEFTTIQIRDFGNRLLSTWEEEKENISLSGRSLYNLISLKRKIEEEFHAVEEALVLMLKKHGAELDEATGALRVPPERQAEAQKALEPFGEETISIEYAEIKMQEDSQIPVKLLEVLFDFVTFDD